MPPAVYALSMIVGEALATTIVGYLMSSTFLTFAMWYGASYLYSAVFGKKSDPGIDNTAGRQQMIRSSISPRNLVYGDIVISGTLVYVATSKKGDKDNQYLHMVVALAAHEVDDIGEIYLNDDSLGELDADGTPVSGKYNKGSSNATKQEFSVNAGQTSVTLTTAPAKVISVTEKYITGSATTTSGMLLYTYATRPLAYTINGATLTFGASTSGRTVYVSYTTAGSDAYVRVKKFLGTPTQDACAELVAEIPDGKWTTAHRLQGIAYVYVRLEYDADLFETGVPTVRARVRGRKVLDPRTGTTAWSANWALCVYDYLMHPEGFGLSAEDIDTESVKAAANISDEGMTASGYYGAIHRYQCHGTCLTDATPDDNLRLMMTAGSGTVVLSGGIMRLHAGAYDVPTASLTDDDLRGPIRVVAKTPRKDLFNAVKGTYVDGVGVGSMPATWQPVDFSIQTNAYYEAQDGNVRIVRDVELPFTKSPLLATMLAKLTLDRARQGITVQFPAKLTAFKLRAWDTVSVTIAKFGWTNKVFRVTEWKLSSDGGIDLVLKEEAAGAYQWNYGAPITSDPAPDTTLPIPGYVPPLGTVTVTSGSVNLLVQQDGTLVPRLRASWLATTAILLAGSGSVQVEYQLADDGIDEWIRLPLLPGDATFCYVSPVIEGRAYNVRARLVSRRGVAGEWSYAPVHIAVGKSDPPSDVPWFVIDGDRLAWGGILDRDLAGYRIRFQYGANTNWDDAVPLHDGLLVSSPYTPAVKPQGDITLMIKAVDTSGNESLNVTFLSTGFVPLAIGNVVENFDMQARGYALTFITD